MRIEILEDRGIHLQGDVIDTSYPHARQWVESGLARYVDGAPPRPSVNVSATQQGNLDDLTVPQLKKIAKGLEIEGYANMNKDPLIDAIFSAQYQEAAEQPEEESYLEDEEITETRGSQ